MKRFLLLALSMVACGPKPMPIPDSGPEDAGFDGGVDAGRPRGDDPPGGRWTVALPLPGDAGPTSRWGVSASMALDQYGQPMIAALVVDPNSDGVYADNRLVFTRWNGLDGGFWQAPVTVEVVGDIDVAHPNRQVSLARSESSGVIGVAYVNEGGAVRYGHSEDEGAHFSLENVNAPNTDASKLSNPALALRGDSVHVAYSARPVCAPGACGKLLHRVRTGSGAFTDTELQGTLAARDWPFALALNAAGSPAVAFFSDDADGGITLSYVESGSTQTIAATDLPADTQAKIPSVSLSIRGDVPRVAYHLLTSAPDAQLWYAIKTSGAWSTPQGLPRNGPSGMLDGTQWYQAIVTEKTDKLSVVANFSRTGTINQPCPGGPKLLRSTTGASWTACHPPETGGALVHTLNQAGLWVTAAEHRDNKLTIALDYESNSNPSIGGGVIVYREQ